MKKDKKMTPMEWEIMKVFWKNGKCSVRDVVEELPNEYKRAYTTIQTYIERLASKGFLSKEKDGKINFYKPILQEQTAIHQETVQLVKRVFNGSFSHLSSYLVKSGKLSLHEIDELNRLIDSYRENNNDIP
ncbi:MAG: BlaI/MecI/CopY family transcriptional regulator [Candidatus Marinimicrobia bacterium]|nr:BlaI/MecI/CopY family transcriptional regulator [Candidatus Neomarinimicrobiota bacterium]MDD5583153.1 BlaI/MecI/CopY family transcriptional regulator [Candidatus Neomarinimicrobiota bacterium]